MRDKMGNQAKTTATIKASGGVKGTASDDARAKVGNIVSGSIGHSTGGFRGVSGSGHIKRKKE